MTRIWHYVSALPLEETLAGSGMLQWCWVGMPSEGTEERTCLTLSDSHCVQKIFTLLDSSRK